MPDDVTVPALPALVDVPNVEIAQVGTWQASTGEVTFTPEDFEAAIAAMDDPAVRAPVIKIGHKKQPGGAERPCIGRLANLRTTNNGMTLVADLIGVPAWLAAAMPSAFPSRSLEGWHGYVTAQGRKHDFVVDGLALLGESLPAVETLAPLDTMDGLIALYGVAAEANPNDHRGQWFSLSAVPPRQVAAQVAEEDVRREYYDRFGWDTWIRRMYVDPLELIVDDDLGHLWRVPVTVNGDEITFGERTEVIETYVAASESERPRRRAVTVYASRQESLPEGEPMDLSTLRTSLGLPDDATDEAILAAAADAATARTAAEARVAELETAAATPPPEGATPPAIPEGAVLIDAGRLADLEAKADEGARVAATVKSRDREAFIDRVRAEGRLGPDSNPHSKSLREHLEKTWDADPNAAQVFASSLARIAATTEIGHESGAEGSEANDPMWDDFERNLSPDVAATRAARQGRS